MRQIKRSHFQIGSSTQLHLEPLSQTAQASPVEKFDIAVARRKLGDASWNHGQSPTRYESINKASFSSLNSQTDLKDMKKAIQDLKFRITESHVMQNISSADKRNIDGVYQTFQHSVHQNFGDFQRTDPKFIEEQKARLSKANFLLGLSPPVYTSTNLAEH